MAESSSLVSGADTKEEFRLSKFSTKLANGGGGMNQLNSEQEENDDEDEEDDEEMSGYDEDDDLDQDQQAAKGAPMTRNSPTIAKTEQTATGTDC